MKDNSNIEFITKTELCKIYKVKPDEVECYLKPIKTYINRYHIVCSLYDSVEAKQIFTNLNVIEEIMNKRIIKKEAAKIVAAERRKVSAIENAERNRIRRLERQQVKAMELNPEIIGKALYLYNKLAKQAISKLEHETLYQIKTDVIEKAVKDGIGSYIGIHKKQHKRIWHDYYNDFDEVTFYDAYFKLYKIGNISFHQPYYNYSQSDEANIIGDLDSNISSRIDSEIIKDMSEYKAKLVLDKYMTA